MVQPRTPVGFEGQDFQDQLGSIRVDPGIGIFGVTIPLWIMARLEPAGFEEWRTSRSTFRVRSDLMQGWGISRSLSLISPQPVMPLTTPPLHTGPASWTTYLEGGAFRSHYPLSHELVTTHMHRLTNQTSEAKRDRKLGALGSATRTYRCPTADGREGGT